MHFQKLINWVTSTYLSGLETYLSYMPSILLAEVKTRSKSKDTMEIPIAWLLGSPIEIIAVHNDGTFLKGLSTKKWRQF